MTAPCAFHTGGPPGGYWAGDVAGEHGGRAAAHRRAVHAGDFEAGTAHSLRVAAHDPRACWECWRSRTDAGLGVQREAVVGHRQALPRRLVADPVRRAAMAFRWSATAPSAAPSRSPCKPPVRQRPSGISAPRLDDDGVSIRFDICVERLLHVHASAAGAVDRAGLGSTIDGLAPPRPGLQGPVLACDELDLTCDLTANRLGPWLVRKRSDLGRGARRPSRRQAGPPPEPPRRPPPNRALPHRRHAGRRTVSQAIGLGSILSMIAVSVPAQSISVSRVLLRICRLSLPPLPRTVLMRSLPR